MLSTAPTTRPLRGINYLSRGYSSKTGKRLHIERIGDLEIIARISKTTYTPAGLVPAPLTGDHTQHLVTSDDQADAGARRFAIAARIAKMPRTGDVWPQLAFLDAVPIPVVKPTRQVPRRRVTFGDNLIISGGDDYRVDLTIPRFRARSPTSSLSQQPILFDTDYDAEVDSPVHLSYIEPTTAASLPTLRRTSRRWSRSTRSMSPSPEPDPLIATKQPGLETPSSTPSRAKPKEKHRAKTTPSPIPLRRKPNRQQTKRRSSFARNLSRARRDASIELRLAQRRSRRRS